MKKFLLILCIICITAQAGFAIGESYADTKTSWIGYTLDDIIKVWGYPNEERKIAQKQLYVWNVTDRYPFMYSNVEEQFIYRDVVCPITVEVDQNAKIVNMDFTIREGCTKIPAENPQNRQPKTIKKLIGTYLLPGFGNVTTNY